MTSTTLFLHSKTLKNSPKTPQKCKINFELVFFDVFEYLSYNLLNMEEQEKIREV